ncbi:transcriptional Coactivator p15-domain-containing protein [Boletus coccyginus]|nr:transcriptional Coactivator p15-domain-containing protein [Boletus coccyginus]
MTATNTELNRQPVCAEQSTASKGKAPSKPKTAKKPKFDDSDDEASPAHEGAKPTAVKVFKNAEGEKYVDLGKKKRAAVRSFKGLVFVDIREFYGAEGDEKPGKKGISLSKEQWEALKQSIGTIDSFFAEK